MTRWVALIGATCTSLLLGLVPQDPKSEDAKPAEAWSPVDVVVSRVVPDGADGDPYPLLVEAYESLGRLREQHLEGRQKELLDRAVSIYKQAVSAYGDSNTRPERVRAQARVALEMSRTVERLSRLRQGARPDPELPPPPPPRGGAISVEGHRIPEMPPAITFTGVPADGDAKDVVKKGHATITLRSSDRDGKPTIVVNGKPIELSPDVLGLPHAMGGKIVIGQAELDVKVDEKELRNVSEQLAAKARDLAIRAQKEADTVRRITLQSVSGPDDAGRSLKEAFDGIQKAREEFKDNDDARYYLDVARDLYNAARKEAEAGRLDRAAELAQASITLTRVPGYLTGREDSPRHRDGDRPVRPGRKSDREIRKQVRVFRAERKPDAEGPDQIQFKIDEEPKAKVKVEVHTKTETDAGHAETDVAKPDQDHPDAGKHESDAPSEPEAEAIPEPEPQFKAIGGLGVQFEFDEGKLRVQRVLPDTPAEKSGKLRPGMLLLGIDKDGEKILFESKEREEIVGLLRGEPGTTVSVIVSEDGDDDEPQVITLERALIAVPTPDDADAQIDVPRVLERVFRGRLERQNAKPDAEPKPEIPPELP